MGLTNNVLGYFFQAGIVVKTVMLILLVASIFSWTLILQRYWYYRKINYYMHKFNKIFNETDDLSKLYQSIEAGKKPKSGLALIFCSGFKEFVRLHKRGEFSPEAIKRHMNISTQKNILKLEQNLPILASIGSVAPYVGLFGTVWGIMTSFQALGHAEQATIAMVAPGISEALVATALGLFTAIPAVIAFNRYSTKVNTIAEKEDIFQEELLAIFYSQLEPKELPHESA